MVQNIVSGGAASSVLARSTGTDLRVIDVGTLGPDLGQAGPYTCRKVRAGSRDLAVEPALSVEEFVQALAVGREQAGAAVADGVRVVAAGEMGIGNSTPASCLTALLAGVQLLTRLPVPGRMNRPGAGRSLLREAVVFFPLVGGLIGLLTGATIWAAAHVWPAPLAVLLGLIVEAVLTGAFHEDAVADCCDAFGGGWSREDVLAILKDSRIGSFGALGLTLAVLLRAGCLAALEGPSLIAITAAAAGPGRWTALLVMAAVPPIPDREGLARDVAGRISLWEVVVGTLLAVPAVGWYGVLDPVRLGCGLAALLAGAGGWAWYVRRRLGGVTGDCLGLACYLGQLLVLLAAAARVGGT